MQDCKDGSGLQFINLNFLTGGQEIKVSIQVELCIFLPVFFFFVLLVHILSVHHF